jgi:hypothetical protein
MDPFAPDSDQEDDADHPLSASQRGAHYSGTIARGVNLDGAADLQSSILDDDDDEPPASILLGSPAAHTHIEANGAKPVDAIERSALHQSRNARAGPSSLRESVQLASLNKAGNAASLYEDDRDDASEGDEVDELRGMEEQAGLLQEPRHSSASSSSSSSRKRDKGLFHNIARKVRKRAAKVQAENGILGGANARKTGARGLNARERALWEWGTRENMDEFLQEVRSIRKVLSA